MSQQAIIAPIGETPTRSAPARRGLRRLLDRSGPAPWSVAARYTIVLLLVTYALGRLPGARILAGRLEAHGVPRGRSSRGRGRRHRRMQRAADNA